MTQHAPSILRVVADALEGSGIAFMVVGSFASSVHGEPRTTLDIDIVIDPTPQSLDAFLTALDPNDFYVDAAVARDALQRRTMFNLIDMHTAWKVDLVIRRDRPFSIEELERRITTTLGDMALPIATAEDTIIAKLEWAKAGSSDRQLVDVAKILRTRAGALDIKYVERWVRALDLHDQWRRALDMAR